jgi:hypothetical protein
MEMTVHKKIGSERLNGTDYLKYLGADWITIRTKNNMRVVLDNVEVYVRGMLDTVFKL